MKTYIDNSAAYAAEVNKWTEKFEELMLESSNAPEAILAYYLPNQNSFVACPLDDLEFKQIGEVMRENEAMLTAAEDSGLMAEAMEAFFHQVLDNSDSWHYMWEDVEIILTNPRLSRYVRFEQKYIARKLLAANLLIDDNEDLWYSCAEKLGEQMRDRKLRGFACDD